MVRGEINEKTAHIQARSFMARTLEQNGEAVTTRQIEQIFMDAGFLNIVDIGQYS